MSANNRIGTTAASCGQLTIRDDGGGGGGGGGGDPGTTIAGFTPLQLAGIGVVAGGAYYVSRRGNRR